MLQEKGAGDVLVSGGVGAFGTVFGLVGLLFAVIGAGSGVAIMRRWVAVRRNLDSGLVAEGVVLDTYLAVHGRESVRTVRRAIIGFRTPDGVEHRIDDASGRPRVVGDHVTVRYLPGTPERGVAADAMSGRSIAAPLVSLVFLGVFVLIGLLFAAIGFGIAGFGFGGLGS
ncbi:DUF3592 domain-containing protein [Streptacidiphilus anmyonensis]|uniref:DUF3592 domain-containing protein n=1 Tax=Streptacidiphilus anmyonensis TaxID=405782 RepID=UPI000694B58C|nr:DUF3592 domain-containing protein [Streptacidiphilus anmyonensis]